MNIQITVKCVGCGNIKTVDKEQKEMPMCENDFLPMIAEKATIK
jgi:hypothetical protein